jgi:hypothetical protein
LLNGRLLLSNSDTNWTLSPVSCRWETPEFRDVSVGGLGG